jgi:hypothetical protein
MLRNFGLVLGLLFVSLMATPAAQADRRVALVIGNSAYVNAAALRNPRNDAADMAETLKKLGFEVELGLDLDQRGFGQIIEKFGRDLDGADVGVFFYAGHALQISDKNYLVSTTARLENEFLITSETMELEPIVRLMESKSATNLIFLDACRNNPLADNLRRSLAATKRSANLGRGLARIEATGRDTLIAFAAAPGQEATDGSDRNSPFTAALLRRLPQPGIEVSVMLKEVAADVRRDTRNSQRPQQLSDMSRTFYFVPTDPAATKTIVARQDSPETPVSPSAADRSLDVAYWNSVQVSNDCDSVRTYLQRFPNGAFVDLARLAERRLCTPARRVTVEPGPVALAPAPEPVKPPVAAAPPVELPPPPPAATPAAPPEMASPNIAALPEVAKLADEPAEPSRLARNIQLELTRLGCFAGTPDGAWGKAARDAVVKFNRHSRAKLNADQPSDALMAALRQHEERVCPLVCGRGYRADGDTCVAIERAPRAKERAVDRRARERGRTSAVRGASVEPAAPAAPRPGKPKGGAAPKSEFASPLCQSRIQVGSKWCCTYDPERGPSIVICR